LSRPEPIKLTVPHRCRFWPDAFQFEQHGRHRWHWLGGLSYRQQIVGRDRNDGLHRGEQGIPCLLTLPDLLQHELEPVEFSADLRFQMGRKRSPVAGCELVQSFTPVSAMWLISADALPKE
jgi:hypothetical protein